jgi:hypothetical protein
LNTTNAIVIQAPIQQVFEAAKEVLEWPRLLAHYRRVAFLGEEGKGRVFEMAAHRDGLPVKWRAVQEADGKKFKVHYRHIAGWTKGMDVWWHLKEGKTGTEILLTHELPDKADPLSRWFYQAVVGDFFVHDIAGKTLAGLKVHLEKD